MLEKWPLSKERSLLLLLLIISFFLFFYRIGAPSYFETDEVIYSQVAREIVRTGDWVTLHLFSKNWFIHPPFYMWLVAASSYIFGDNEFNTRLWVALFAVGLLYVTYLLGKRMFRDSVGLTAAFILATSLQYFLQARIAIFDIPLVFFEMLALFFFFSWTKEKQPKYYYLFFLSMALAVLMKGPVGIVLPLLAIIPYLLVTSGIRSLVNIRLVPGLIITFLIGGGWYAVESVIHGRAFIDSVFGFYIIGRYLTSIESHYGPWYFYVPVVLAGFLPWVSFLPFSINYQWMKKSDNHNLFCVIWMAAVFLFFTVAGTKLPGYIMSMYPVAAISIAKMFSDHLSNEEPGTGTNVSRSFKFLGVYSIILMMSGVLFRIFEAPDGLEGLFVDLNVTLLLIGAAGLASTMVFFHKKSVIQPMVILVTAMLLVAVYTASSTMFSIEYFKPMRAISQKIRSEYMTGQVIAGFNVLNKGSFQHYVDKPIIWIGNIYQLRDLMKRPGRILLITNENDFVSISKEFNNQLFLIFKAGEMVLISNRK